MIKTHLKDLSRQKYTSIGNNVQIVDFKYLAGWFTLELERPARSSQPAWRHWYPPSSLVSWYHRTNNEVTIKSQKRPLPFYKAMHFFYFWDWRNKNFKGQYII